MMELFESPIPLWEKVDEMRIELENLNIPELELVIWSGNQFQKQINVTREEVEISIRIGLAQEEIKTRNYHQT